MIRVLTMLMLLVSGLCAQAPSRTDLLNRTEELERLIAAGDWEKASQLSRELKAAVTETRNRALADAGSQLTESVLNWLPTDTETLVVASEPFPIPGEDPSKVPSALQMAQGYVIGLLAASETGEIAKTLRGRTVRLAVMGGRRFGVESTTAQNQNQPGALGMVPYQGCAAYAFAEPLPDPLVARPADDVIAGHRIWTSKGTQNDVPDRDSYLVSVLQPDLVAVCNSREFFEEMVLRIGTTQRSRALPAALPEWKQVDRQAPLWGISHYAPDALAPKMFTIGDTGIDPQPTGITVAFGLASGLTRSRMIARSDPWKEFGSSPDFHGAAKSRAVSPNVWELSVSDDPQAAGMATFSLMALLGFMVLI